MRPFTCAHITRPCSELSVPAPDTWINTISGFSGLRVCAAASVMR
jgi:hypothetical protein